VEVASPGLFWQHYYLLPLPGVAILCGAAMGRAWRAREKRTRGLWVVALMSVAIAWSVSIQVRDYLLVKPDDLTTRYKGGGQWVVLREVGREIGRRTAEWDRPTLAVWGIQSPLAFYSGLDNVTRQVFTDPLVAAFPDGRHPQVAARMARTIDDFRKHPPDLIFVGERPFSALADLLAHNYVNSRFQMRNWVMPFTADGRGLWVRRDRAAAFRSRQTVIIPGL
jgi:hypothetical protein